MVRSNLNFEENSASLIPYAFSIEVDDSKDFLKKHKYDIIEIDQLSSREFSLNNFGWQRNTVSQMSVVQSQEMALAVLRQLKQNAPSYNLKEGFSVIDAFSSLRPRSCQMPNEFEEFAQHLADGDMKRLDAAYMKALSNKVSDDKKETVEPNPE